MSSRGRGHAARGIGQAIANRLAANGATVVFTDILKEVHDSAKDVGQPAIEMNVTDPAQVEAAIGRVVCSEFGRLDILVNNAGINTLAHRVTIDEFPKSEWDKILAVDLDGVFQVSQAGARIMRQQGTGRIINIASIAGLVPLRLQCAFIAAKAGVINLTKGMALELGPYGILVNGIAPGSTLTEGTKQLFYGEGGKFSEKVQRMLEAIVPLGRPGTTVDEIAVGALFLADPENSYMNGHILTIDGGWTAGYTRDFCRGEPQSRRSGILPLSQCAFTFINRIQCLFTKMQTLHTIARGWGFTGKRASETLAMRRGRRISELTPASRPGLSGRSTRMLPVNRAPTRKSGFRIRLFSRDVIVAEKRPG